MNPRPHELTAVERRDLFDALPGGTAVKDKPRWQNFREAYHAAAELVAPEFPLQIDFELNSTCQMKCGFCLHGQGKVKKRELSFEQFCKVIDEGARYGLCSIKLNYINEPLLRSDLPRFVEYARSQGVLNVYFATNGLRLTEEMCRRLIDAKVSKIMISLDATTPETFLAMRRSKHFNEIVANIKRLIEMRQDYPLVRVNFLETLVNQHESQDFIDQWTGVADMIGFQQQVGLPGAEYELLTDVDEFQCAFPFKLVVIDCDGNILPCCTFSGREMPMGNIADSTIAQAWGRMNDLRALHLRGGYAENPVCAHCVGCQ
jgi:radical SAM protein with 4Fe4S-binding SPASM domain